MSHIIPKKYSDICAESGRNIICAEEVPRYMRGKRTRYMCGNVSKQLFWILKSDRFLEPCWHRDFDNMDFHRLRRDLKNHHFRENADTTVGAVQKFPVNRLCVYIIKNLGGNFEGFLDHVPHLMLWL